MALEAFTSMGIEAELSKYNGKNTAVLKRIAARYTPNAVTVGKLLSLTTSEVVAEQTGATRLLKWWHDQGCSFSKSQTKKLLANLRKSITWESRLHIFQMLPRLSIPEEQKTQIHWALMQSLSHENKFVRAWAFNGLAYLAVQYPEYRSEAVELLELGLRDECASVKARIRSAKNGF